MTVVNTPVISCSDMPLGGDVVSNVVGISALKKVYFNAKL